MVKHPCVNTSTQLRTFETELEIPSCSATRVKHLLNTQGVCVCSKLENHIVTT